MANVAIFVVSRGTACQRCLVSLMMLRGVFAPPPGYLEEAGVKLRVGRRHDGCKVHRSQLLRGHAQQRPQGGGGVGNAAAVVDHHQGAGGHHTLRGCGRRWGRQGVVSALVTNALRCEGAFVRAQRPNAAAMRDSWPACLGPGHGGSCMYVPARRATALCIQRPHPACCAPASRKRRLA
jgi:hypothetical protein